MNSHEKHGQPYRQIFVRFMLNSVLSQIFCSFSKLKECVFEQFTPSNTSFLIKLRPFELIPCLSTLLMSFENNLSQFWIWNKAENFIFFFKQTHNRDLQGDFFNLNIDSVSPDWSNIPASEKSRTARNGFSTLFVCLRNRLHKYQSSLILILLFNPIMKIPKQYPGLISPQKKKNCSRSCLINFMCKINFRTLHSRHKWK